MMKKIIFTAAVLFVIAIAFIAYILAKPNAVLEETLFEVEQGNSVSRIANKLKQKGLIDSPFLFKIYIRVLNKTHLIKAGEFSIPPKQSLRELVRLLESGKSKQYSFTIVEGTHYRDLVKQLAQDNFMQMDFQEVDELLQLISIDKQHPEGLFLADTYYYAKGDKASRFLQRAYKASQRFLEKEWVGRDTSSPVKTPYQALILASIIEKETGVAGERKKIAGVFVNRLRIGMRLQTDPTVIYGLGESYDGDIRYRDLRTDTPYNTYTRYGLPPTPIAMPGREAIKAALHPETTDALFFVANGEGGHTFSKTLKEHEKAVQIYLKKTK